MNKINKIKQVSLLTKPNKIVSKDTKVKIKDRFEQEEYLNKIELKQLNDFK